MVERVQLGFQGSDQPAEANTAPLTIEQVSAGLDKGTSTAGVQRIQMDAEGNIIGASTTTKSSMTRSAEQIAEMSVNPASPKLEQEIRGIDSKLDSLVDQMGSISPNDPTYHRLSEQVKTLQKQRATKQEAFDYEVARRNQQVEVAKAVTLAEHEETARGLSEKAAYETDQAYRKRFGLPPKS